MADDPVTLGVADIERIDACGRLREPAQQRSRTSQRVRKNDSIDTTVQNQ